MSSRFSMRELRSSLAADTISNQSAKNADTFTSYKAAPKQRLQLLEVQVTRAETREERYLPQLGSVATKRRANGSETNKERKRKRWLDIKR